MRKKTNPLITLLLFLFTFVACDFTSNDKETPVDQPILKNSNNYTLKEGTSILLSLLNAENSSDSMDISCKNCKIRFVKSTDLNEYVNLNSVAIDKKILETILETEEQKVLLLEGIQYAHLSKTTNYAFLPYPEKFQAKLENKQGLIIGSDDECDFMSSFGWFGTSAACFCFDLFYSCTFQFCTFCTFGDASTPETEQFNFDFDIEQFSLLNLEEIKPLLDLKIKDISIDAIK